jgi:hypothetical protein
MLVNIKIFGEGFGRTLTKLVKIKPTKKNRNLFEVNAMTRQRRPPPLPRMRELVGLVSLVE